MTLFLLAIPARLEHATYGLGNRRFWAALYLQTNSYNIERAKPVCRQSEDPLSIIGRESHWQSGVLRNG